MGGFLYADDLSLIAPSHAILARMLEMVAENGASLNLHFSTLVKNLRTNGVTLLWKESAVHHGHTLQQNLNFDADAATRRAGFIGRSVEVREQFSSASPAHVLKAVRILCCHGYGAVLWRIDSSSASSFFKAYNRCVKESVTIAAEHLHLPCERTPSRLATCTVSKWVPIIGTGSL